MDRNHICSRPWREIYVGEDRKITPCRWYLGEKLDLLDYLKTSDVVLNEEIYKNLRKDQLKTNYPTSCSYCYFSELQKPTQVSEDTSIFRETAADGRVLKKSQELILDFKNNKAPPPLDYFIQVNLIEEFTLSVFIETTEDERNFVGWIDSSTLKKSLYEKRLNVFTESREVGFLLEEKFSQINFISETYSTPSIIEDLQKNNEFEFEEEDRDRIIEILITLKKDAQLMELLNKTQLSSLSSKILKKLARFFREQKKYLQMRDVIISALSKIHPFDKDILSLIADLKNMNFEDDAFEFIKNNGQEFEQGFFDEILFSPDWSGLCEKNQKSLIALYDANDMSSIPFKESKALILKKAGRLEESFLLHLELLKEKNIDTVAESLFSGGWEDLPDQTYFMGEEVFLENINNENAFLQLLRLKKRKNNLEEYLNYLIEFDQKFDNSEVKRELYAGVWREISTEGLNQLVSYYANNIETIKTTREFAINAATYFKLLNRYDEAFSCLWSTKLEKENFVDEGLLNGHWLGLSVDNLKLFKTYLESHKFEGIDKKKAILNIQLINISNDGDVDNVVKFIDELDTNFKADDFYTCFLKVKLFMLIPEFDRAIESHLKMMNFRGTETYEDLMQLVGLYEKNNSLLLSIKALERAIEVSPNRKEDLKILAWNYKKIKNFSKSVQVFQKVLEIDSKDLDAKNEIERMSGSFFKKIKLVVNRLFNYE